jgi:hypothetical protein
MKKDGFNSVIYGIVGVVTSVMTGVKPICALMWNIL